MKSRRSLLEEVLAFKSPLNLPALMKQLGSYGWDSKEELVVLTYGTAADILQRFLSGLLTAKDVENWANAVEMRDDIRFVEEVSTVLFKLSTPELEGPLTAKRALALVGILRRDTPPSAEEISDAYAR